MASMANDKLLWARLAAEVMLEEMGRRAGLVTSMGAGGPNTADAPATGAPRSNLSTCC